MSRRCRIVRKKLMDDRTARLTAQVSEHLSKCKRCDSFFKQYQDFTEALRKSFHQADQALGPPELSFLQTRVTEPTRRRPRKSHIMAAAAAVFAVAIGFSAFFTVSGLSRRNAIREEASRFADALFEQTLFDDLSVTGGDFLSWPDILSELVLPMPDDA